MTFDLSWNKVNLLKSIGMAHEHVYNYFKKKKWHNDLHCTYKRQIGIVDLKNKVFCMLYGNIYSLCLIFTVNL